MERTKRRERSNQSAEGRGLCRTRKTEKRGVGETGELKPRLNGGMESGRSDERVNRRAGEVEKERLLIWLSKQPVSIRCE